MLAVQAVFTILFAYLIAVKGSTIPENSDAHNNENKTFIGESCTANTDCQSVEKCLLEDEAGQGLCVCKAGRSGDNCEIVDDCMTGKYSSCKDGNGRCSYNDEKETAECDCGVAKKWDNILKICRTTCKDDCANNGVCEDAGDGEKFCRCKEGTRGHLCDIVVDCEPQALGRMLCGIDAGVTCVYDENKKGGKCLCDNSTKLFHYDKRKCQVPCKDDCHNSGKCEKVRDYRFCFCKRGTSGDLCERVEDCYRKNFCGTKRNVKCMYDETKEQAMCKCDDPKKAFDFNVKECRIPCKDDCYNNGKCEYVRDFKFCSCLQGTSGDRCEIMDDCITNFCGTEPDVKCVYNKTENKATCKCDDPHKSFDSHAKKCRGSTCADYACQNGGSCNDNDSWPPKCYCKVPFTGERCEKGPCTNSPCKNGGTCQVKKNTYNCICRGNFYGESCEMDIPENRFVSPSILALIALIVLMIFILTCNGCFLFKMNQKLNTVFQTFGVYRPSPGRPSQTC